MDELETLVMMKYGQMQLSIEYAERLPAEFYNEFYLDQISKAGSMWSREMAEELLNATNNRIQLLMDLVMHTASHKISLRDRINQWLLEYESRA